MALTTMVVGNLVAEALPIFAGLQPVHKRECINDKNIVNVSKKRNNINNATELNIPMPL